MRDPLHNIQRFYMFSISYVRCVAQVVFVDSLDKMDPAFEVLGPVLENCTAAFPQRVNAEFVEVL